MHPYASVGAIVQYVLMNEAMLGEALGLVNGVTVLGAVALLWFGSRYMRQALDAPAGRAS